MQMIMKQYKSKKLSALTAVVIATVIIAMCGESIHCFIPSISELDNHSDLKLQAKSHLHIKDIIRTARTNGREEKKNEEKELEPQNRSGRRRPRLSESEIYPQDNVLALFYVISYRRYHIIHVCLVLISSFLLLFILFIHNKDGLK